MSTHYNKQVLLKCENINCGKIFKRKRKELSPHNYCSSSCAATINNHKYPKWPIKFCKICKKPFRREGSSYCSIKCGKSGRFKYTREEIINFLKDFSSKNGRVPSKREVAIFSHKAQGIFGSWNNAIVAARLEPNRSHDNRMYRRTRTKATDGHLCDSISEAIIDNWLHKNGLPHKRNVRYPGTNHLADWSLSNSNVFIEYFGLANDSPRYDRAIKKKINLCKKNGIELICVYPRNLYPLNNLNKVLSKLV